MEKVDFGIGLSMPVRPEMRGRAERFLSEVLGCKETLRTQSYTCFRFPNGQILGITPDEKAPSEEEYERSTWLEIVSSDFESTKSRIREFGTREVPSELEGAFFFNLPGGAVFRMISEEFAKANS